MKTARVIAAYFAYAAGAFVVELRRCLLFSGGLFLRHSLYLALKSFMRNLSDSCRGVGQLGILRYAYVTTPVNVTTSVNLSSAPPQKNKSLALNVATWSLFVIGSPVRACLLKVVKSFSSFSNLALSEAISSAFLFGLSVYANAVNAASAAAVIVVVSFVVIVFASIGRDYSIKSGG